MRALSALVRLGPLLLLTGCVSGLELEASRERLDFDDVLIDHASLRSVEATLRSEGPAELEVVIEPPEAPFAVVSRVPSALVGDEPAELVVAFEPWAPGRFEAELLLRVSSVEGLDTAVVRLRGDALLPEDRDDDRDGFPASEDCDDFDAWIHPGAPEVCDGKDGDCDGELPLQEADGDGDGYRACAGDCDDADPDRHPGVLEECDGFDADCDGGLDELDTDADGVAGCEGDCNDGNPAVYPGAPELCSGFDEDCDGTIPDGEADADGDGSRPCSGDCDDSNPDRYGGAPELCNGVDDDCDNAVPAVEVDGDGDGFRRCEDCNDDAAIVFPGAPEACDGVDADCSGDALDEVDADGDGQRGCDGDCDDAQPAVFAGAPEVCDGLDNDCDGVVPGDESDADGDGAADCVDCAPNDPAVFPGAPEVCNGLDDDCDTVVPADEADGDGDGTISCADCGPADPNVYPGAPEICDGLDSDCDGTVPVGETDDDNDGQTVCDGDCDDADPTVYDGAPEECFDSADNDCDGTVNQGCSCPLWAAPAPGICAPTGSFACPYGSLTAALVAAGLPGQSCGEVWLQAGTYSGPFVVTDDVKLVGEGPTAGDVVLDGGGLVRVLEVSGNTELELELLTVSNGVAAEGGGAWLGSSGTLSVDEVVFDGNQCLSGGEGGAIHSAGGDLVVADSTFLNNNCGLGGANAGNDGGAIFVEGGEATITGSLFEGNTAGDGSAVWLQTASNPNLHTVTQCEFFANSTSDSSTALLEVKGGTVVLYGNRLVVSNNVFMGNTAAEGGGAVSIASAGNLTFVTNNVMVYNSSPDGAGVHFDPLLGAISPPPTQVRNNVIAFNAGIGIRSDVVFGSAIDYNDVFSNAGGDYSVPILPVQVPPNDISIDPFLVSVTDDGDYTNDDFTLQSGSPCIDAGDPASIYLDTDGSRNDMGAFGGPGGGW